MSTVRRHRYLTIALAAGLAVSACSSDEASTDSEAASETTAAAGGDADSSDTTAAEPDAGAGSDDCVAQAKEMADAARAPLDVITPASEVAMADNAGKTIWMIGAGQTEFTQTVANGFEKAAEAAGMEGRYVQADFNPDQMQQLVEQAAAGEVDGIVLFNITPESVEGPLAGVIDNGATIIDFNNGDPDDPLQDGLFAHVAYEFTKNGQNKAAWMLADSGCDLRLATFNVPTLPVVDKLINGSISTVNELCPDCTVNENEFSLADFGTALGPQAETVLRREPDINYIDPAADAFASVISPVLQASDNNVVLVGHDGNPSNLAEMAAGNTLQQMTIAGPPEEFVGWMLVDQLSRGMLGMEPANGAIAGRIIDSDNIGDGSSETIHPGWEGYEDTFREAWGV